MRVSCFNSLLDPALRLFCFPHAGGGVSLFREWHALLPPFVEVLSIVLPGRDSLFCEKPHTRLASLVADVGLVLEPYVTSPFALFGHSMGSLVGFELARALRRNGKPMPEALFVSAHRAPQLPDRRQPVRHLPDAEFVSALRKLQGTPIEVLDNAEMLDLYAPVLRADFEVCETYRYVPEHPLGCPISAFGGTEDAEVPREELDAWRAQTDKDFRLHLLAGNHFFLHTAPVQLLARLGVEITRVLKETR